MSFSLDFFVFVFLVSWPRYAIYTIHFISFAVRGAWCLVCVHVYDMCVVFKLLDNRYIYRLYRLYIYISKLTLNDRSLFVFPTPPKPYIYNSTLHCPRTNTRTGRVVGCTETGPSPAEGCFLIHGRGALFERMTFRVAIPTASRVDTLRNWYATNVGSLRCWSSSNGDHR